MKDEIVKYFDELIPNPKCELEFKNDFELLIAIVLSAQTTDKKVNSVTPLLFKKYPSPSLLKDANILDVIEIIKPLGLANNKSKNIINLAGKIVNGIPDDRIELMKLPGVGRKTANVFLAEAYNKNTFGVDTHVIRVSNRLGLVNSKDPLEVEKKLTEIYDGYDFKRLHHEFILFGRYYCLSKRPKCESCKLQKYCQK